ncbi:hypothetical protein RRG08_046359 [Elysia crispata]|uniref:Uncharacterized protein n=1 Tax=Elysia crispata TaxID=231223 RepID=A0AAE1A5J5_9GAST|nr:hypothetical protein RRG08_046359 [Elysia crispata]
MDAVRFRKTAFHLAGTMFSYVTVLHCGDSVGCRGLTSTSLNRGVNGSVGEEGLLVAFTVGMVRPGGTGYLLLHCYPGMNAKSGSRLNQNEETCAEEILFLKCPTAAAANPSLAIFTQ